MLRSATVLIYRLVSLLSSVVPNLTLSSLLQSITTPVTASTSKGFPSKLPTVKSDQPFFLTVLTNRIKKCSGCGSPFHGSVESAVAPENILGHLEWDWFSSNDQWQLGKLQNKYYHLKVCCLMKQCSLYQFPKVLSLMKLIIPSVPMPIKEVLFGIQC